MSMNTSFVSEEAADYTRKLINEGKTRKVAQYMTDEKYHYPRKTMASYFGKLGAKAKRRKKLFFPERHYTEEEIRADTERSNK